MVLQPITVRFAVRRAERLGRRMIAAMIAARLWEAISSLRSLRRTR